MQQFCKTICLLSLVVHVNVDAGESSPFTRVNPVYQDTSQVSTQNIASDSTQQTSEELPDQEKNSNGSNFKWTDAIPWLIAFAALAFTIYQHIRGKKSAKEKEIGVLEGRAEFQKAKELDHSKKAEDRYRSTLEEELGSIRMLGSPEIESIPVRLLDAFVTLNLSETWRNETRFDPKEMTGQPEAETHATPEAVMKKAFQSHRLLLLIGDPGSGKTTLIKYYAMCCLHGDHRQLGFKKPVLPIYFPLRELEPKDSEPDLLPTNLAAWADKHLLDISHDDILKWLHERNPLVLLDGLDEISNLDHRRRVCDWIDNTCAGLTKARFVVTSRWTGYRKADGIELAFDHLRADVKDFSQEQQEEFLQKWFRAVFRRDLPGDDEPTQEWESRQRMVADQHAKTVIEFLNKPENKSLRQLAAVPMLLQIMAIIWKEREHLPRNRNALYDAALSYLLDFRDRRRKLEPVLPADIARRILIPVSLWMQEELQRDEVAKKSMHEQMQPHLNTLAEQTNAEHFCVNLRDRAGIISDYGQDDYVFRHKSFREYMAGQQLIKESHQQERIETLIQHFGDDWWEEPIRFFISESDDIIFDRFMGALFESEISLDMDQKQKNLLQILVREAPQKKIDSLVGCLKQPKTNSSQRQSILECLKTIGTSEAIKAIQEFALAEVKDIASIGYAKDIVAESEISQEEKEAFRTIFEDIPTVFRNPYEENAEYILIPGGQYKYSVSGEQVSVSDTYFAKYPVTNKRYRRFVAYLEGRDKELEGMLSHQLFSERLLEFAETIEDYQEYLGADPGSWSDKLCSEDDQEKRFNQDDQPVVGVTWYAARAYCFWLSMLEASSNHDDSLQAARLASMYRLPDEVEWEWAAAGREPDGSLREYPWPKKKGEPSDKLANFGNNVGHTTPVGRYPDGATPEGLMDMAGNVWEWMENMYGKDEPYPVLRGGSWNVDTQVLRCSARLNLSPVSWSNFIGFRVVRPQS